MTTLQVPYFSVVIPTLNEEDYLPRILKNLNEQSMNDFEVLVVDGNSEDQTPEIAKKFEAKYTLKLLTDEIRQASHQRNLGARQALGKVLVFFDADTQIPKNYLEKLKHVFEARRPHCLTTYLRVDSRKPSEQWFVPVSNLIFEIGRIIKAPLAYGAMQAIKRTVFEDIGGYDEKTYFGEDSQLFQTAIDYNYKFIVTNQPRYVYSLRRLRAEGSLESIYQYFKLNLTVALKGYHADTSNYEMGGARYKRLKKNPMTQRFDKLFLRLRKQTQQQSQSIKAFLDQLFPF